MERDEKQRSGSQTQPQAQAQTRSGRTDYREFLRVVSRVIDEHPAEVAVIEDHIKRYRASAAPGADLTAAANQQQQILLSLMQSEQGRAAAQTLDDAYRQLGGPKGGSGGTGAQILPIIIAWAVVDIIIWGCVALDCV
jgi:hypothetical protein